MSFICSIEGNTVRKREITPSSTRAEIVPFDAGITCLLEGGASQTCARENSVEDVAQPSSVTRAYALRTRDEPLDVPPEAIGCQSAPHTRVVPCVRTGTLGAHSMKDIPRSRCFDVEGILDDFDGFAMASTTRERLVCNLLFALGAVCVFVFSFAF